VQTGSVTRHGRGWRGHWREDGKRHSTATYEKKGQARGALNTELDRVALGDRYMAPITLRELADRFLAQHVAAPQTISYARRRLVRPLAAFGDAQAGDVTPEAIQRLLAGIPGKAWRHDILRTLRMTYRFGLANRLVAVNPAAAVKGVSQPVRGERILPLSIDEVDQVAFEAGRWGAFVLFMADTGARPAEAVAVEWRHVDLDQSTVELPGQKTEGAWRTVHMTSRGVAAIKSMPRSLLTRHVFHVDGRPISFDYFRREVWHPALELAGLETRAPYCLRHSYALHCLQAGVPIATLARQMGHTNVSRTYKTYGGWVREMGADAAALRESWAASASQANGEAR
jgi:integrase